MAIDTLKAYKAKRNFAVTSEPTGSIENAGRIGSDTTSRRFVIQKHWARSLHYDFRLELDGTMKSWALPKGPSFDSKDKRLAVHVEDHPISYAAFEGTIPDGQYGAGKVIVWDTGLWEALGDARKGYRDGNLKFELHGHKLHGRWALVRMKGKSERQDPWLLIKEKDAFVRPAAEFSVVDEHPDSVKGLRMAVAKTAKAPAERGTGNALKKSSASSHESVRKFPDGAVKAALPEKFAPQLATLAASPPTDPEEWVYEIKFDGYRLLTRIDGADIRLFTRNGNDWTEKLRPLQKELARLKLPSGWYDGEIVVPGEHGVPDFGALQQSFDDARTKDIVLYLFDLPYFDGYDLRGVPLASRRELLQQALQKKTSDSVRFSDVFDAPPESVVASACKLGLEGIIAKRRDSTYVSRRSSAWIKLKCSQRQEFVIGGYTAPQGSRSGIGALLLGVHDDKGALKYAGKVGTGFSDATLLDIKKRLDGLTAKTNPFHVAPPGESRAHWVKPLLVAEVSFGEWTRSGHIRHAVFRGLRKDKPANVIVRERPVRVGKVAKSAPAAADAHALPSRLRVTNPERVIDAASGTTKIELVRYYDLVADLMLPHLKSRPVSLVRAPAGVGGELFFQKHAEIEKLTGVRQLDPALDPGHAPMLEVAAKQGLLSAAQWNVIEFHTSNAIATSFAHPDRMVFDLDPGEGTPWAHTREGAELVHAFLKQLGLNVFLKTSGGKGLHLVVPLRKVHDWDTVKAFAHAVVLHLAKTIPERFVAKSGPKNRVGKIFIDYLRNGMAATTVCAWSARARPGLGISVPVDWAELKSLRGADQWNVRTAHARLDKGNEPWAGYTKAARSLTSAMKMLDFVPGKASPS